VIVRAQPEAGAPLEFTADVRIDTPEELTAFRHGGILPYVLRRLMARAN
jgi:aconitate hydratase